jgi:rubrerythrin
MLSRMPLSLENLTAEDVDKEILRAGMIAELDAINLYEQMAALTKNEKLRTVLLDVAKEEKTHVGEFQALLLAADKEQESELKKGKAEVIERPSVAQRSFGEDRSGSRLLESREGWPDGEQMVINDEGDGNEKI